MPERRQGRTTFRYEHWEEDALVQIETAEGATIKAPIDDVIDFALAVIQQFGSNRMPVTSKSMRAGKSQLLQWE